ncbi:cytochrome P450 [Vararia minispora EC-137]|uniref:Cytochrome P450 n=1 Tax=Vararia minispora EC-137 TaxID=1314806 RepID=A0ACB8QSG7_9AGAM|nr:cytochrome P450 [Vararia minispora EC-137]
MLAFCTYYYIRYRRFLSDTPPGPKPLPFLGNIFDIPTEKYWVVYNEWSKEYNSELISVRAFGQLTIIINSARAARELLGRRSSNYSDKPRLPMLELIGWDWNPGFMPYGERWRVRRRLLHRGLNVNAVATYYPVQVKHTKYFLAKLRRDPRSFVRHIKELTAGLTLDIAYALEDDACASDAHDGFQMLSDSLTPAAALVNAIPALKYVVEWLPMANYHAFAERSRQLCHRIRYDSLTKVKRQVADGTARPSLTLSMLNSSEGRDEEAVADVAGVIFGGESNTSTASAIHAGLQALALHPDVQRRAQAEIDAVVGRDRLPGHEDMPSLPYATAICREILRWHAVGPLGAPRAAIDDDVYDGWLIPAGSTILWNAWAISHDPETYPNPNAFIPERFLDENGQLNGKEEDTNFGYGRRECVGIHFAKATLWVTIASMLSIFNLFKAKDEQDNEIEISTERTTGLASHPVPFVCDIRVRDDNAEELLDSLTLAAEAES